MCVRVSQCLLFLGVVRYSQDLLQTLATGDLLPVGGERELEIRGCSIWAVEVCTVMVGWAGIMELFHS